jgi:hypothetical protein
MTSQPCRLDPKGSNICKMKSTNQGLTDNEEKMILWITYKPNTSKWLTDDILQQMKYV